jgi:hypothetical protein
MFNKLKSYAVVAASAGSFLAAGSAHAALPTEVTAAITAAQTDLLALFAALTVAGAAIWVGRLIYRKFSIR